MRLTGERLPFGRVGRPASPWRILAYLAAIGAGLLLFRSFQAGQVRPLLLATPTPTRTADSHAEEGRTQFSAGRLDDAIAANPEDPLIHAVRTLVYDWSAAAASGVERDRLLKEAEESAVRALQLDPGSPLALAYYAELLLDEGKFAQAFDQAEQAAAQTDPFDPLSMDVHRVFGTVLEGNGAYRQAIEEYQAAAEFAPNFTYLYLLIGTNYRTLGGKAPSEADRRVLMNQALEAFDRAARINEQLGIADPTPYLAIGRPYLQDGEFFIRTRRSASDGALPPSV